MRIVTRHAVAVLIVMFLVIAASAQVAWANLTPAGDITLVSTADGGTKGNGHSFMPSLSGDGATVAFHSLATNLDPGDIDAHADVYVKDLATGDIVLASTADDGTKGNGDSFDPSLSADGTTVAFGSTATNLDPADTDAYVDIYVKDLVTGDIALASITRDGTKGNNDSIRPSLSADGTRVAFESFATNFDPADGDFDQDVYVKDLVTGEVILASSTGDGTKGNDGSSRPSLSADGTGVAFDSRATNLDPVDTDGCRDVYVKDLATGEITLASLADDGTKGTCFGTVGGSSVPSLNADATKVAFESTATDLDPGDGGVLSDIYVKDLTRPRGLTCFDRPTTIDGTDRSDVIVGTSGPDVINAAGGNDRVDGAGGDDFICGGDGNDRLLGGDGIDYISGGAGNDRLEGETGNDYLQGDAGADRLEGGADFDALAGGEGVDQLRGGPGVADQAQG
jgi:Tol biopolymer transport system component